MCPNKENLANIIENNVIGNNGYTYNDVINANKMLGPNVESLKGKMVQKEWYKRTDFPELQHSQTLKMHSSHGVIVTKRLYMPKWSFMANDNFCACFAA